MGVMEKGEVGEEVGAGEVGVGVREGVGEMEAKGLGVGVQAEEGWEGEEEEGKGGVDWVVGDKEGGREGGMAEEGVQHHLRRLYENRGA